MKGPTHLTQPSNPALEAAAARAAQRRELARQQQLLQVEELIADAKGRVDQYRARLGEAEQRLTDLEKQRADLVAQAPEAHS